MADNEIVIFNTGSRTGTRAVQRVAELIARRLPGERPYFASISELDRIAQPPSRIIAIGGDGTLSLICNWMARHQLRLPIAVIPAGTGNNLARGLGVFNPLEAALEIALTGKKHRSIDAVHIRGDDASGDDGKGRIMIQTAAVGFPAEIAARYARARASRWRRALLLPFGQHAYSLLATLGLVRQKFQEWRRAGTLRCRLALPDEDLEMELLALFIGNERSLGGNFLPCPLAELDDGRFDLCAVSSGESYIRVFRAMSAGTHLDLGAAICYRQTFGPAMLRISRPVQLMIDGDIWVCGSEFKLELLPRRFEFIVGG